MLREVYDHWSDVIARVEPSGWVPVADRVNMQSSERIAIFDALGKEMEKLWQSRKAETDSPDERRELKMSLLREIVDKRDAIFKQIGDAHQWEHDNRAFFAIMGAQPPVVTL